MSLIVKEWKNRMEENRIILYTFISSKGRPSVTFLQGIPLLAENILTGIGSQKNKNFMQPCAILKISHHMKFLVFVLGRGLGWFSLNYVNKSGAF